jgi:hypothetical protein
MYLFIIKNFLKIVDVLGCLVCSTERFKTWACLQESAHYWTWEPELTKSPGILIQVKTPCPVEGAFLLGTSTSEITRRSFFRSQPSPVKLPLLSLFDGPGVWTQDLWLGRKVLFPLSHAISYFCNWVSNVCPGQSGLWSSYWLFLHSWDHGCPTFIDWNRVLRTFSLGRPQNMIFPISASQIAGITGISYCAQLQLQFLGNTLRNIELDYFCK